MAGIEARIADLLLSSVSSRLSFSPSIPVSYPGVGFDPEGKSVYLEATHLVNRPETASAGTQGYNRHIGIFQIAVVTAKGAGIISASEIASTIAQKYSRGTVITDPPSPAISPPLHVRIYEAPHVGSTFPNEQGWMVTPVSIRWYCDAPNPTPT